MMDEPKPTLALGAHVPWYVPITLRFWSFLAAWGVPISVQGAERWVKAQIKVAPR